MKDQAPRTMLNDQTLFLDRDGVLNERPGEGYVTTVGDFHWLAGSLESLVKLADRFRYIIVVSNQQGIGKGLMDHEAVETIHKQMIQDVERAGGRIDLVLYAGGLRHSDSFRRKPGPGMALEARNRFPDIRFDHSYMVGDTFRDMLFGYRLGMQTALVSHKQELPAQYEYLADFRFASLNDFTNFIINSCSYIYY